MSLEDEIVAL